MAIKDRLKDDMVKFMKGQDKDRVAALRLVMSEIKRLEVDTRKDLDDAAVTTVLSKMTKQRQDSIEQFSKGGRDDLVKKETAELELIRSYMPQQLSRPELESLVQKVIQETGASSAKDMGRVMKQVIAQSAGRADGKMISEIVRSKLP